MTAVSLVVGGATALGLTAVLVEPLRRIALRRGLTDNPAGHKAHRRATPYLGGVAIAAGVLAPVAVLDQHLDPALLVTLAAATGVGLLGLVDDVRGLGPGPRLVVETVMALVVVLAGAQLELFGPQWMDGLATVVWIVVLTNSFNLLDNTDGALAVVALACAVPLAVVAPSHLALVLVCVAGAGVGFLLHNHPPARIFMGDAGSLFLGFLLAAAVPLLGRGASWPATAAAAVLAMGVAIVDTALVVVSRRRHGRSILTGGTDHVAHRLRRVGLSGYGVLSVLLVAGAAAGAVAALVRAGHLPGVPVLGLTLVLAVVLVAGLLRVPGYPAPDRSDRPVRLPRITT